MKVALVEAQGKGTGRNKDQAGSFGTSIEGASAFGRIVGFLKKTGIKLPLLHFGYINGIFQNAGHETTYHYNAIPEQADLVFMNSSIVDYPAELALAAEIKKATGANIGFVGAFATVKPEIFLSGGADFVISGEPEDAAMRIANGKLSRPLKGIVESNNIDDLDILPYPNWDGFPVKEYSYSPTLNTRPFLISQTSRGCPFNCNYCPYIVLQKQKPRFRTVEKTVGELEYLQERYGIKGVLFRDILFTQNKERIEKLCAEIKNRGIKLDWCCETRTDCITEPLIDKMIDAGMKAINFGIESADPEILRKAKRIPTSIENQERIINYCEDRGVKTVGFYIVGFPDDTEESIAKTVEYACRVNTTIAQFTILTPYPGTGYFDGIQDQLTTREWSKFNSYNPVVRTKHLSPEKLVKLKDDAFRKYYLRPSWLLKRGWKAIT
ncbi:MAG: radical SAM protein [Candidatus Micrarchaeota archaeon]